MINSHDSLLPKIIYGTAWKEDRTSDLAETALKAGFRAFDTANQRKHYFEQGLGNAIQVFLNSNGHARHELFIQSKFTFALGQDHRKPYNESDPYPLQVRHSFESSLDHLGVDYLDSYVLHGPFAWGEVSAEDFEVWAEMENIYTEKKVLNLGISNVSLKQLELIFEKVSIKPKFVQNRCFANQAWDLPIRNFCKKHDIAYQGFSLLTANRQELQSSVIQDIANKYDKEIPQVIFRFSQQSGMIPLTGTTDASHMKLDLQIEDFSLDAKDLQSIQDIDK